MAGIGFELNRLVKRQFKNVVRAYIYTALAAVGRGSIRCAYWHLLRLCRVVALNLA